jgi:hypothetical protein
MAKKVSFSEADARRIASTVRAHERGNRDQPPVFFRQSGDDSPVRLCKTSAAWNKGTTATLNVWEDGTPGSETQSTGVTLEGCVNNFANIASNVFVIVGLAANGKHYLLSVDLTTITGYAGNKQQALTHSSTGLLTWVDTTAC